MAIGDSLSGLRATTPDKLVLDESVLWKNFDIDQYNRDFGAWNPSYEIVEETVKVWVRKKVPDGSVG